MNQSPVAVQRSILSPDALSLLVLPHYNLHDSSTCQFWNHSINDTYMVNAGETKFFLRVSPAGWRTTDQINAEIELLDYLHQHQLSVPQAVARNDGTHIHALNAPEGIRYAVLFTFVPGASTDMTEKVSRQYGQAVARLHAITDDYPTEHSGFQYDFIDMLDEPLNRIKPLFTGHRGDYEYLLEISHQLKQATETLLRTSPQYGICHGDLNASNFHLHEGGWSLVDFEYFGSGWRIFDIATFINTQLIEHGRTNETYRILDAFVAGYQEERALSPVELKSLSAFVVLRQIWLLGTSARYIPKSTIGVDLHRRWIFQQVMPFIREWIKEAWRPT